MRKKRREYNPRNMTPEEREAERVRVAEYRRPKEAVIPVEGEGLLYAMRFVEKNGWQHDRFDSKVSLIKSARKMLKESPLKFDEKMRELQAEEKAPVVVEVDLGEAAALRVLDRLLSSRPGVSHGPQVQEGSSGGMGSTA